MWKLSIILLCTFVLIVEAIIVIPPCSFKWHAIRYLGKFSCFLQEVIFMFHLNGTRQKFKHHRHGQCRFLIYHWILLSFNCLHVMIVSLYSSLTSFSFLCVLVVLFVWLSVKHFSFSRFLKNSLTNTDTRFNPFIFHLFYCTLSLFKVYCYDIFIFMFDVFLGRPVSFLLFSFNHPISFIFVRNFRQRKQGTNIFRYNPLWIAFLNVFYGLFRCFNWPFFSYSHFSVNYLCPTACWGPKEFFKL